MLKREQPCLYPLTTMGAIPFPSRSRPLPFPPHPSTVPFPLSSHPSRLPLPSLSPSFSFLPSVAKCEAAPLKPFGERCKLPQRRLGWFLVGLYSRHPFGCILRGETHKLISEQLLYGFLYTKKYIFMRKFILLSV